MVNYALAILYNTSGMYFNLSNSRGGRNKRGGVKKFLNKEGINKNGGNSSPNLLHKMIEEGGKI